MCGNLHIKAEPDMQDTSVAEDSCGVELDHVDLHMPNSGKDANMTAPLHNPCTRHLSLPMYPQACGGPSGYSHALQVWTYSYLHVPCKLGLTHAEPRHASRPEHRLDSAHPLSSTPTWMPSAMALYHCHLGELMGQCQISFFLLFFFFTSGCHDLERG